MVKGRVLLQVGHPHELARPLRTLPQLLAPAVRQCVGREKRISRDLKGLPGEGRIGAAYEPPLDA